MLATSKANQQSTFSVSHSFIDDVVQIVVVQDIGHVTPFQRETGLNATEDWSYTMTDIIRSSRRVRLDRTRHRQSNDVSYDVDRPDVVSAITIQNKSFAVSEFVINMALVDLLQSCAVLR